MRYNTLSNANAKAVNEIRYWLLHYDLTELLAVAQKYDPSMTTMKLTQIVSDLVVENHIQPVFLNPVTNKYTLFPKEFKDTLKEIKDKELYSKKYRSLKKTLASRAKNGVTFESEKSDVKIEGSPVDIKIRKKKNLFRRLFGI